MELGAYNIGRTLKLLSEKHVFTPSENLCTLKLLSYIDKCKDYKSTTKEESVLNEVLKMYLLEIFFRKKFFGILKYKKSVFIERDIYDLPEKVETLVELTSIVEILQDKNNPIRRKISFSRVYLPNDILKLINE